MSGTDEGPERIWGLDLAGLGGKNNTGLVMSELRNNGDNVIEMTVFRKHPFSFARKNVTRWDSDGIAEIVACLQKWTDGKNHLYVDIPVDLQGLPDVPAPLFIFQTKRRVADFLFGGLPPFASWIGSQTTDFHFLAHKADILDHQGHRLFEAYPRVTIESICDTIPTYKGKSRTQSGLNEIQEKLNIIDPPGRLNDDDIDAIVCVLSGIHSSASVPRSVLAERWNQIPSSPQTSEEIEGVQPSFFEPPKGYRILPDVEKMKQQSISIKVKDWSSCHCI
jgi:hypothetical protein